MDYVYIYLVLINIITLIVMAIDKSQAVKKRRRVSEKTLILLSVIGGSAGELLGMKIFHHKTKKAKFYLGVPAILFMQIIILLAINWCIKEGVFPV